MIPKIEKSQKWGERFWVPHSYATTAKQPLLVTGLVWGLTIAPVASSESPKFSVAVKQIFEPTNDVLTAWLNVTVVSTPAPIDWGVDLTVKGTPVSEKPLTITCTNLAVGAKLSTVAVKVCKPRDLERLRWWVQCSLPWTRVGIRAGVTVTVTVTG